MWRRSGILKKISAFIRSRGMEPGQMRNNDHPLYRFNVDSLEILQVTRHPEKPTDLHPLFLVPKPACNLPENSTHMIPGICNCF